MPLKHGMHRTDRRQLDLAVKPAQFLADLRCAPARPFLSQHQRAIVYDQDSGYFEAHNLTNHLGDISGGTGSESDGRSLLVQSCALFISDSAARIASTISLPQEDPPAEPAAEVRTNESQ